MPVAAPEGFVADAPEGFVPDTPEGFVSDTPEGFVPDARENDPLLAPTLDAVKAGKYFDALHAAAQVPGQVGAKILAPELPPEESVIGIKPELIPQDVKPPSVVYGMEGVPPEIQRGLGMAAISAGRAGLGMGQYLSSPQGIVESTAAMTPISPAIIAKWMLDMGHGVVKSIPEAWEAYQKGDYQTMLDKLVMAGAMGAGVAKVAHGIAKGTPRGEMPQAERVAEGVEVAPSPPVIHKDLAAELQAAINKRQVVKEESPPVEPVTTQPAATPAVTTKGVAESPVGPAALDADLKRAAQGMQSKLPGSWDYGMAVDVADQAMRGVLDEPAHANYWMSRTDDLLRAAWAIERFRGTKFERPGDVERAKALRDYAYKTINVESGPVTSSPTPTPAAAAVDTAQVGGATTPPTPPAEANVTTSVTKASPRARYDELASMLKSSESSPAQKQAAFAQIEQIKNENGGMPPTKEAPPEPEPQVLQQIEGMKHGGDETGYYVVWPVEDALPGESKVGHAGPFIDRDYAETFLNAEVGAPGAKVVEVTKTGGSNAGQKPSTGRVVSPPSPGPAAEVATGVSPQRPQTAETGGTTTPPPTPKTPIDVLNEASRIRVRAPEGATQVRVTDAQGRQSVQPISAVNKGANPFRGAGISKIEAGTIGRKGFTPTKGDVLIQDKTRGEIQELHAGVPIPGARALLKTAKELVEDVPEHLARIMSFAGRARARVSEGFGRRGTRGEVNLSHSSASNDANVVAKQVGNVVSHQLNRDFGERARDVPDVRERSRENALSAFIEAGGAEGIPDAEVRANLQTQLTTLQASPHQDGVVGARNKQLQRAINFALNNMDRLKPAARAYQHATDAEAAYEGAHGRPVIKIRRYVPRTTDMEESFDVRPTGSSGAGGPGKSFQKMRTHDTLADKIAEGEVPDTINAIDALVNRVRKGQRLVNLDSWSDQLRTTVDPIDGNPVVAPAKKVTKPNGEVYFQAPVGYQLYHLGTRFVAVHDGYVGLINAITEPSWFQRTAAREGVMKAITTSKHIVLLADTFHLGRLAMFNASARAGLLKGVAPRFKRGLTILDNTMPEIQRMIANGEIPADWARDVVRAKEWLDLGVGKRGLNVGQFTDNIYADWTRKIPGFGDFNKWLFDDYARGAMSEVYLMACERLQKENPTWSRERVARQSAQFVNKRFGNLGNESFIKSKTARDFLRTLWLAPQWNESLLRSEGQFYREVASSAVTGKPLGIMAKSVATAAVGTFLANQIINYYTRGKPTWENEEAEDEGAAGWMGSKISAWIPDYAGGGPGFFLNPAAVPLEMTHLFWKLMERNDNDATKTILDFVGSRANTVGRALRTFATGKDSHFHEAKSASERLAMTGKELVPWPMSGNAVWLFMKQMATGEHQEAYQGQFQKQLVQSFGQKLEGAPTNEKRIRNLAVEFNRHNDVREQPGFHEGDYTKLTQAIRRGNMTDANDALDELLMLDKGMGIKKSLRDVSDYYRQWIRAPFTHNRDRERAFYAGLSAAQKEVYQKAMQERVKVATEIGKLLSERAQKQ